MQRRNYYSNDPRWIRAKYPGRCFCGAQIKPGDQALYYPIGRKIACQSCGYTTEAELADDDANRVLKIR